MKAYPQELRLRIIEALNSGEYTKEEVSEMYGVSLRTVFNYQQILEDRGTLESKRIRGHRTPTFDENGLEYLRTQVVERPDTTLKDLVNRVKEGLGIETTIWTIQRGLKKLEITLKKRQDLHQKQIKKHKNLSNKNRRI